MGTGDILYASPDQKPAHCMTVERSRSAPLSVQRGASQDFQTGGKFDILSGTNIEFGDEVSKMGLGVTCCNC